MNPDLRILKEEKIRYNEKKIYDKVYLFEI